MSGVWVFRNGVMRLVENPASESDSNARRKVLVHQPTDEVITSYASLDRKLTALGWERYYDNPDLIQYHKRSSVDLISLPRDFNNLKSFHLYDIVVKSHSVFEGPPIGSYLSILQKIFNCHTHQHDAGTWENGEFQHFKCHTKGEVMSLLLLKEKCTCDRHIEGEDVTELEAFGRRNCSPALRNHSKSYTTYSHPEGLPPPADCSLS